ncbi:hypothetical protein IAU60_000311 [Kwoniella sp. DSM 27419]
MLALVALVPVLGALSASAMVTPEHMKLFTRQDISSAIPSACSSQCTSTLTIYNACMNNQLSTCLQVCNQDTFNEFTGCFDCVLTNTAGVSSSEQSQLDTAVEQLKSACSQAGQTVTGGLSGAAAATDSATGTGATSGILVSATSGAAGVTIAASGVSAAAASSSAAGASSAGVVGSATGAVGSAAASVTGAAQSAAGSATGAAGSAAASASAPASGALSTVSLVKGFVAFAGVAAGMAIVF